VLHCYRLTAYVLNVGNASDCAYDSMYETLLENYSEFFVLDFIIVLRSFALLLRWRRNGPRVIVKHKMFHASDSESEFVNF
jgi:hypothetical protein